MIDQYVILYSELQKQVHWETMDTFIRHQFPPFNRGSDYKIIKSLYTDFDTAADECDKVYKDFKKRGLINPFNDLL